MMTSTVQTATTPGERMTRTRLWVGLEQRDMAELLGVSRNTIGNWERGVTDPPFSAVAKWAQITGRSIDWIAFGDARNDEAPAGAGASDQSRLWDLNPRPVLYEGTALPTELRRRVNELTDDDPTTDLEQADFVLAS